MTKQRRFYVPEDYQQLIDKLIRILRREGKSLSRWILENAIEYVKRHEPGNPQMLMNKFLKKEPARARRPYASTTQGPLSLLCLARQAELRSSRVLQEGEGHHSYLGFGEGPWL